MFLRHHRLGLLLALGVAISCPAPARAWTEFLSMDVLPEDMGWTINSASEGSSTLFGGVLTINSPSYRDYVAPADWANTVDTAMGYTIEFRMHVGLTTPCFGQNVGVGYGDKINSTILAIDPDRIWVYGLGVQAPLDATQWHAYRIVVLGSHHRLYVDGQLTLDFTYSGDGSTGAWLEWGDIGCGWSSSQWDYVAYETQAVVPVAQTTWGRLKTLYRGER